MRLLGKAQGIQPDGGHEMSCRRFLSQEDSSCRVHRTIDFSLAIVAEHAREMKRETRRILLGGARKSNGKGVIQAPNAVPDEHLQTRFQPK